MGQGLLLARDGQPSGKNLAILKKMGTVEQNVSGDSVTEIPNNVSQFIDQTIESLDQLEMLLAMYRQPGRQFGVADICQAAHASPETAETRLNRLVDAGLVRIADDTPLLYVYAPQSEEIEKLMGEIAEVYSNEPVVIIRRIYEKNAEHLRIFSEAFKLKKTEP
jgi:hypothetical protein